jgi:hypothetical protein
VARGDARVRRRRRRRGAPLHGRHDPQPRRRLPEGLGRRGPARRRQGGALLRVDEAARVATVEWEYTFGEGAAYPTGYSKVFGDHDRLPTSNHLAVWWPGNNTAFRDGANAEILELTDDKAHVLEIDIYGETDVLSTMYKNWKIYAVERVYARPLVWAARCDGDELSAKTVNTYKESHLRNGTLEFLDATGAVVHTEAFQWGAFWRPTTVAAPPAAAVDAGAASLRVLNQHGQTSRALPISC